MSTWLIFMLVAAVLAIIVSGLFIGTCLLIAWAIDAFRGDSDQRGTPEQKVRGQWDPRAPGGPRPAPRGAADSRYRNASGVPVAYRRDTR